MCVFTEALGDFDEPQRSSMTMFGVLTIAVRIYQDRWGYGIYSGPIGSAVFIITVKWVSDLSPSLRRKINNPLILTLVAVPAAEDEAAAGGLPRQERLHAAGRTGLLLRRPRPDVALLFRGDQPETKKKNYL